jgi:CBS domain-containing protein
MTKQVGGPEHELFPVREVNGAPRVSCPRRGGEVLFSECQSCEHGTQVRLKGHGLPYMLCPAEGIESAPAVMLWEQAPVSAIMGKAVTVRPSLTIEKLVREFLDEDVTAAVVVDDAGAAVGMVTRTDILSEDIGWVQLRNAALSSWPEEHDPVLESEDDLFLHDLLRGRTVGDVMTRGVVWVAPELSIPAAAEVMAMSGLQHLPVLGPGDRPAGMLSAFELAQWLGQQR